MSKKGRAACCPASKMSDSKAAHLLREPLLHFLAIGLALYLVYGLVNDDVNPNRIVITQGEIDSYQARWTVARSRAPSDDELQGMIEMAVRDKILAREALALGLDQDDSVVQRRLAQKMEFLLSDLAQIPEPSDEELQTFLQDNLEMFSVPERISFTHIFFNPDKRKTARDDARQLLARLIKAPGSVDIQQSGDRFMLPSRYASEIQANVSRMFGKEFAEDLFASNRTGWQEPLDSGYGVHLVFIETIVPEELPELVDIRADLQAEWARRKQNESNEALYRSLLERYEVVIGEES